MSPAEYRACLDAVGLTVSSAAKFFHTDDRTTRRWACEEDRKDVPHAVAVTLRLMIKYGVTPDDVTTIMHDAESAL